MSDYHHPVLLSPCIEALDINPEGCYVDATFGGGGHANAILDKLTTGKLVAFDQDQDAAAQAKLIKHSGFLFVSANFRYIRKFLQLIGISHVDGIFADLGISSHQIDDAERGFSTRFTGPLDMRMNPSQPYSAYNVVNEYAENDLKRIFREYGELKNAHAIARDITVARTNKPIQTTSELMEALSRLAPKGKENKFYAMIFQAIRIEVNEEIRALEEFLEQTPQVLKPGGNLVVLSYHSLEDRRVKLFMQCGNFQGDLEKDLYGNIIRPYTPAYRKPIMADEEEIAQNNRSRSARLRKAIKN